MRAFTELLRVPIAFGAADGATVHAPMVHATVDGIATRLVVDTGSDVHILVRSLADEIGLALAEGEEGTDASGTTMPSWSGGPVELHVGEAALPLGQVVVIPAPAPFPGWGIGGILSPQHLWPDAWAAVDLMHDELVLVRAEVGPLTAWLVERSPELTMPSLARDGTSGVPVIRAAIVPFGATEWLLDSGGRGTDVDRAVAPGLVGGSAERLGGGVSGTDVLARESAPRRSSPVGSPLPSRTSPCGRACMTHRASSAWTSSAARSSPAMRTLADPSCAGAGRSALDPISGS